MRKAAHPIDPLILNRWPPRAMSGEPITHQELMQLFEAARWARKELAVPEGYVLQAMFAVGKPDSAQDLPKDM